VINGKRYAWEDITINLPHGEAVDVDSIEYSDKKEIEAIYGKGSNPRGYAEGNYSGEAKLTLLKEEFDRLIDYAKGNGGSPYRMKPFTITVSYANDDEPTTTDTLRGCKITAISGSQKQGDRGVKREVSLILLEPILWNGVEANPDTTSEGGV